MRNRGFFEGRKVLALNLVSSPGSGKTALLERTINELGAQIAIGVIEGDQETDNDAQRIKATGAKVGAEWIQELDVISKLILWFRAINALIPQTTLLSL